MKRFEGRVAVITGASRGIGLGVARRLVDEGARVCLTARKPEALQEAVAALGGQQNAIAVAGPADHSDHQAEALSRTLETFGRVDVLVNNAGINPVYGPLLDLDLVAARKILDLNVLAALSWVQQCHQVWMSANGGAIVNLSSVAGLRPAHGLGMYGISKAAVIQLTQQLAIELGPDVRVNAVAPAVVKTKFARALYEGREDEVSQQYALKRLGVPEDVAGAVAFLASDDAGWVTGQTLVVDGGLTLAGGV